VQQKHNGQTTINCSTLTIKAGKKGPICFTTSVCLSPYKNSRRAEGIFVTFDFAIRDISFRNVDKGPETNSVSHSKDTGSSSTGERERERERTGHKIDHLTPQVKNDWK